MNNKSIVECERERLRKWGKFRLPHVFMTIGISVALLCVITMFLRSFLLDGDTEWLKELSKKGLLVGMLLMSLSKDKEEDELTISLRMQSYSIAFVAGVVYALVMPFIEYGVSNILKPDSFI